MKTIKMEDIPAELKARDFLASLDPLQGEVVVEQGGQAWLVMSSAGMLRQRQRARDELWALIGGLRRRNPAADSDQVLGELEELDQTRRAGS